MGEMASCRLKGFTTAKSAKVHRWRRKAYLLPDGRPLLDKEEMHLVLDAIRLYDPMLAQICLMSYKHGAHPIFGIALAHYNDSGTISIGGVANKFPVTELVLDSEDAEWFKSYVCVGADSEMLLIFSEPQLVKEEVTTRWENAMWKLRYLKKDIATISIGSFLFTKLHEIGASKMDMYEYSRYVNIPHIGVLDLLLQSTGIVLDPIALGEEVFPPDPFAGYEHLRPKLGTRY